MLFRFILILATSLIVNSAFATDIYGGIIVSEHSQKLLFSECLKYGQTVDGTTCTEFGIHLSNKRSPEEYRYLETPQINVKAIHYQEMRNMLHSFGEIKELGNAITHLFSRKGQTQEMIISDKYFNRLAKIVVNFNLNQVVKLESNSDRYRISGLGENGAIRVVFERVLYPVTRYYGSYQFLCEFLGFRTDLSTSNFGWSSVSPDDYLSMTAFSPRANGEGIIHDRGELVSFWSVIYCKN